MLPGLPWPHHVDYNLSVLSTRSVFLLLTSPSFSPPAPCLRQRHLKLDISKAEFLLSPRLFLLQFLIHGGMTDQHHLSKLYLSASVSPKCKGAAIWHQPYRLVVGTPPFRVHAQSLDALNTHTCLLLALFSKTMLPHFPLQFPSQLLLRYDCGVFPWPQPHSNHTPEGFLRVIPVTPNSTRNIAASATLPIPPFTHSFNQQTWIQGLPHVTYQANCG